MVHLFAKAKNSQLFKKKNMLVMIGNLELIVNASPVEQNRHLPESFSELSC